MSTSLCYSDKALLAFYIFSRSYNDIKVEFAVNSCKECKVTKPTTLAKLLDMYDLELRANNELFNKKINKYMNVPLGYGNDECYDFCLRHTLGLTHELECLYVQTKLNYYNIYVGDQRLLDMETGDELTLQELKQIIFETENAEEDKDKSLCQTHLYGLCCHLFDNCCIEQPCPIILQHINRCKCCTKKENINITELLAEYHLSFKEGRLENHMNKTWVLRKPTIEDYILPINFNYALIYLIDAFVLGELTNIDIEYLYDELSSFNIRIGDSNKFLNLEDDTEIPVEEVRRLLLE